MDVSLRRGRFVSIRVLCTAQKLRLDLEATELMVWRHYSNKVGCYEPRKQASIGALKIRCGLFQALPWTIWSL